MVAWTNRTQRGSPEISTNKELPHLGSRLRWGKVLKLRKQGCLGGPGTKVRPRDETWEDRGMASLLGAGVLELRQMLLEALLKAEGGGEISWLLPFFWPTSSLTPAAISGSHGLNAGGSQKGGWEMQFAGVSLLWQRSRGRWGVDAKADAELIHTQVKMSGQTEGWNLWALSPCNFF